MPLAHARLKDGAAQSAGRGLAFQPPSRDRLPMSMLLQLQRLAGNRAVADLIGTPPRASVQRVTLGWQGADDDSWNKGAETITAEGKKGAPGDEGVVRIPVGGIAAGQAGSVKGEAGCPMIGILPQGAFFSQFGPGGQLGVNVDAYVNDVFGLGLKELGGTTPGRVTLSGWSGAGLGITQMVAGSKAKAAGEKIPGG